MCEWGRALRGRGAAEEGDLARPDRPSRCTLPITALRVMPPSSAAIWLADSPSVHSFLRRSTRSSVHIIVFLSLFRPAVARTTLGRILLWPPAMGSLPSGTHER